MNSETKRSCHRTWSKKILQQGMIRNDCLTHGTVLLLWSEGKLHTETQDQKIFYMSVNIQNTSISIYPIYSHLGLNKGRHTSSAFLYYLVPTHIPASLSLFRYQSLGTRWRFHMASQTGVVECTPFKNPRWCKLKHLSPSEEQEKVKFSSLPSIFSNVLSKTHLCNS